MKKALLKNNKLAGRGQYNMSIGWIEGFHFAVWDHNAQQVSVMGDFNQWKNESHLLASQWEGAGIWRGLWRNIIMCYRELAGKAVKRLL